MIANSEPHGTGDVSRAARGIHPCSNESSMHWTRPRHQNVGVFIVILVLYAVRVEINTQFETTAPAETTCFALLQHLNSRRQAIIIECMLSKELVPSMRLITGSVILR